MTFHSKLQLGAIHIAMNFQYANAIARQTDTELTSEDVLKFAHQTDDDSVWMLVDEDPLTWVEITNIGSGSAEDVPVPIIKASPGTLVKGQAVHATGWNIPLQAIEVEFSNASIMATMPVLGLVKTTTTDTIAGDAVVAGALKGFDTSHLLTGWHFHADIVDGEITSTEIQGPNVYQILGECVYSDVTEGVVKVTIESFKHLGDNEPQELADTIGDPSTTPWLSRSGHVHAHGNRGGGDLHQLASTSYDVAITAIDEVANEFTVAGDVSYLLHVAETFVVVSSTGNDGDYTVLSITFDGTNTIVTTSEDFTDPTVDGSLRLSIDGFLSHEDKQKIDGLVSLPVTYVRKATAGTIVRGAPVYVAGHLVVFGEHLLLVEEADSNDPATMPSIGLAYEELTDTITGIVLTSGDIDNFDTSMWAINDPLYVGTVPGTLVNTRPTGASTAIQKVAIVVHSDAADGHIFVMGAGRSNALPNLSEGNTWVGDADALPQETTITSITRQLKAGLILAASFAGSPNKATITFNTPYTDANYAIELTAITQNDKTYSLAVESKTKDNFVINTGTNNITDLLEVDWRTTLLGET